MKQVLRRLLVLAGLSVAFSCVVVAQQPRILGGYKEVPTDNSEVVEAAEFAVTEQGQKQETPITLVSIEKAERQSAAGSNFKLCLKVEVDDETQDVKVLVRRSLDQKHELKSWEEGSCDESEGVHAHALSVTRVAFGSSLRGTVERRDAATLTDPVATFVGARIVHNVTVKGQKGMRVHANFRVRYGLNVPCRMIAYFYDEDGTPLEAADNAYTTQQGKVSTSANFTPRYDPAVYNDLQIFIPYVALNMESGDAYDLKFYLALYDKDGERFFGKSGWYKFRLIMP